MLCYCWPIPYRLSQWWRQFQGRQNFFAKLCVISRRLTGTRKILQARDAFGVKPASPINDCIWPHIQFLGDLLDRISAKTSLDNLCSLDQSRFHRSTLRPFINQLTILFIATRNRGTLGHNSHLLPKSVTYNYYLCN